MWILKFETAAHTGTKYENGCQVRAVAKQCQEMVNCGLISMVTTALTGISLHASYSCALTDFSSIKPFSQYLGRRQTFLFEQLQLGALCQESAHCGHSKH